MRSATRQLDDRPPPLRRLALVFAACGMVASAAQGATSNGVTEEKLKSAFIYNFTKFVEWPPERFVSAGDPIVIGLLASESMQAEITEIVANRFVNGRALVVRPVVTAADLQASHILFVSSQLQSRYASLREKAPLASVLIVGDDRTCRAQGGGICFTQQGDKLRFEINIDTVEGSKLRVSSQLQKLAVAVNKGR